jgi:2-methylaconitate cis-trans-isomerase PrpF
VLKSIPCTLMRGGTSKGLFFREEDLPPAGAERDRLLLSVMGSPDLRQIDGLGGAVSTTSKVAIIARSCQESADVDYTFAQVAVDKAVVDYRGNCGNISSAVGPYAIESGLVAPRDPETVVRICNTNTGKVIFAHVKTPGGKVSYEGDFAISGVPGTSAPIKLAFENPAGAVTGKLLPTGNVVDRLEVEGVGGVEVSIVDVSNPLVFVRARDVGLTGKESPEEIDSSPDALRRLEAVRGAAAVRLGFVANAGAASLESPAVPKLTIVAPADSYRTASGESVAREGIDFLGRMMSMQRTHKTYALTGALCTAAAAIIQGTVVSEVISRGYDAAGIRIGNPGGIIQAGVEAGEDESGELRIHWAFGYRTARLLMSGTAFYI